MVERLNGIEEVRGSNPLGSRPSLGAQRRAKVCHAGINEGGPRELHLMSGAPKLRLGSASIMQRFFYVYILVSEADTSIHYTGRADDLSARLRDHNRGKSLHTAKHKPWRIETAVAFTSEIKARAFEGYLKSGSGREFARRHF